MNIVVLVDFENDSVRTALVARALGPRLWGVGSTPRPSWSTARSGRDGRLRPARCQRAPRAQGARRAGRRRLRAVRIVVSGGFTVDKIEAFERKGVPVDAYGIGSSLIRGQNDFTADIVMTDGRPSAKVGRRYRPNPLLELVT